MTILLLISIVLLMALVAVRFSDKIGLPSLLLFIVMGMITGAAGIKFDNYNLVENFATVALMIIMFYGGFGTNWKMAKPAFKESALLASLGVVLTAVFSGLFFHYALRLNFIESMLLASVIASTDYASVSSILRSKNLNLKDYTAPLLELESGSNDPTAYTMTIIFISILKGVDTSIPILILTQMVFGVAIGFIAGYLVKKVIKFFNFSQDGLLTVFILSVVCLSFAISNLLGGNGYLTVYLLGIYLGNQEFIGKRDIVFFFDGFTNLVQIGMFYLLGLLSNFSSLKSTMSLSIIAVIFLTVIARPLATYILIRPFKRSLAQIFILSLAGLRGAAAIAFAIIVVNSDVPLNTDIFHIVFGICLISQLVQGTVLPIFCRKLNMVDENDTVLKTFNYYQDKSDVGFIVSNIPPSSILCGKKIADLHLAFDFIIAKIIRSNKTIIPRGDTVILEGDTIVVGGESYFDPVGQELMELKISNSHPWLNKKLCDLKIESDSLIVMIQSKEGKIVIPTGETTILEGDAVIVLKVKEQQNRM